MVNHQKQKTFNPDFFIKFSRADEDVILVVEIKEDGDNSAENKSKYTYSLRHFDELNKKLKKEGINERYIFHFLSPKDYQTFFQYIRNGKIFDNTFKSELEVLLEE